MTEKAKAIVDHFVNTIFGGAKETPEQETEPRTCENCPVFGICNAQKKRDYLAQQEQDKQPQPEQAQEQEQTDKAGEEDKQAIFIKAEDLGEDIRVQIEGEHDNVIHMYSAITKAMLDVIPEEKLTMIFAIACIERNGK